MRTNFRPAMDRPWNYRVKVGTTWDPNAASFILTSGLIDDNQKLYANDFYLGLKADTVYDNMWEFLLVLGGTSGAHSIYGKDPSRTPVTWVGSPTHDATGVKGNGSSMYGNSNWNPATVGIDDTNFGLCVYRGSIETTGVSRTNIGMNGGRWTHLGLIQSGSRDGGFINGDGTQATPASVPTPATEKGFLLAHTYGSNTLTIRRNKTVIGTRVQSVGSLESLNLFLLANNNAGAPNRYSNVSVHSFFGMTKGLSQVQADALCDRVTALQTSLSRA